MTVSGCLSKYRLSELQFSDYASGSEVKHLRNCRLYFFIRKYTSTECIDVYGHRCGNSDSISKLYLGTFCKSCCNNILCSPSCRIGSASVNLCGVLAAESSAAVMCSSAVGVNDYLSACKAAVANWSADNKSASRIYKDTNFVIEPLLRDYRFDYIFDKVIAELFLRYFLVMLS